MEPTATGAGPAVSSLPGWSPGRLDTVVDALERAVTAVPDRLLLDCSGDRYTYRELDLATNRLAHALRALGVSPGDTLLSMLDNHADAVIVWLAISKLGAVSVPINTALRGEFLRHQVSDANAALVVAEPDYVERLCAVADGTPAVQRVLVRGATDGIVPPRWSGFAIEPLDDHRGVDARPLDVRPAPEDLALLVYTSGTTGPSKGCMVSFNYMCNLARLKLRGFPAGPDDMTFTPLPLFHMNALVSGFTSTVLTMGGIAIAPRFSVSGFWPEVERTGATIVSILGSMGTLLAQASDDPAMLRCHGQVHTVRGNPFHAALKQTWRQRFGAINVGSDDYGLTEAAVVTSLEYPAKDPPPGSSGTRNPDFDVRIVDDQDNELPPGQAGEIIVRPLHPHVMFEGYWRRPEDTLRLMRNMWFHTGDIGKFDERGYFSFVDRKKDYLRRRGENISSFEMEASVMAHPDVDEAAVHAVPSPFGEDDVKVTAVLAPGALITEQQLCEWMIDKVPYFALPRFIEFRDSLPKNPQGKVLKYQLRDEGVTARSWDRESSDITVTKR